MTPESADLLNRIAGENGFSELPIEFLSVSEEAVSVVTAIFKAANAGSEEETRRLFGACSEIVPRMMLQFQTVAASFR